MSAAGAVSLDAVALSLGYTYRGRRLTPCPSCRAASRKGERRGAVGLLYGADGRRRWKCNACRAGGDVIDFVRAHLGENGNRDTRSWFASRGWADSASGPVTPIVEPDPVRPPQAEILAILKASTPLSRCDRADVLQWAQGRGIDARSAPLWVAPAPHRFEYGSLTRAPVYREEGDTRPVPVWWPGSWAREFPILAPMYDAAGQLAGLRGRAISSSARRKTTAPIGFDTIRLLLADPWVALPLLRGASPEALQYVLFAEGDTDYASAAQTSKTDRSIAVIGLISGSPRALVSIKWPARSSLVSAMDPGEAGDRYHQGIVSAVAPFPVRRVPIASLAG